MDISGCDVEIIEEKDGVHDSLTLDWFQTKGKRVAWQKIVDWLDSN